MTVMSVWCFLALLTLAPVATGTNPGIIIRVSQKALDYGQEFLIDNLDRILNELEVPEIRKEAFFTEMTCTITDKQIRDLTKLAVKFDPATGITLSAEDVIVNMRGHFKCFGVDQDYYADVERLVFSITIKVENNNGNTSLNMSQCILDPGTMTSNINPVYRMIVKGYKYFLAKKKFCSWLEESQIPKINNMLATKVLLKVESLKTEIDMLMVNNPVISSDFLDLSVKGVFNSIGKKTQPPFSPPSNFQLPKETDKMFYMGLSDFTINSLVFGYYDTGVLRFDITDDMIPSGFPFRLSTTTFGAFIPEITKNYPKEQMMKLSIGSNETPIIKFKKGVVEVSSTVKAYVIDSNNNDSPLFELRLEASVNINLDITEQKLTGTVTLEKIGAKINNNKLGEFRVTKLEEFMNNILKVFVFPVINAHLKKGYSLPLQPYPFAIGTIEPVNIKVQILNDYLLIGSDVKITIQP